MRLLNKPWKTGSLWLGRHKGNCQMVEAFQKCQSDSRD